MFWNSTQECIFKLVTFLSAHGWEKIGKLILINKSLTAEKNFSWVSTNLSLVFCHQRERRETLPSPTMAAKAKPVDWSWCTWRSFSFTLRWSPPWLPSEHGRVCMYLCISVSQYVCIFASISISISISISMSITYMSILMHVHMCTFMQTHSICTWTCTDIYLLTCN